MRRISSISSKPLSSNYRRRNLNAARARAIAGR
jgi:hypothetical protein